MFARAFVVLFFAILAFSSNAKDLSVLTIGNSFTWSLDPYFKKVVESAGHGLHIEFANFGGCELRRHWKYIEEESNSSRKIYGGGKQTLAEILKSRQWDIVTIQQASHESWQSESYQPFAKNICAFVKKHAPNAKIVIQQTWSYRADAPRFEKWGFDNEEMFKRVKSAYAKLASEMNLEIIPVGEAVSMARANSPIKFKPYTKEELKNCNYPDLPKQAGDVVGNLFWKKNKKGQMTIVADTIHLNSYGKYLQACVWFVSLYDEPASKIKFIPNNMADSTAREFQAIADKVKALNK